ncbi:MAG: PIN domain-containing protein [Candidatus Acidiferrum sp.]|jgi:hypothetical protein
MRDLFPAFFPPTEEEFKKLWSEATFAFDANVLLDLYRVTPDTQQAFFDVLQKLDGRIFLPHQSAFEYLRSRIATIAARSRAHEALKEFANKLASGFESHQNEYPSQMATECAEAAKRAANDITEIVDKSMNSQPDLLKSDDVLSKLSKIFSGKTGKPYDQAKLEETYKKGRLRYAEKTPPGFRDDTKPEPNKFGDLIIWFQLIDYAASTEKPVIFVSGDAKEDWWWKHEGRTIGPRWELGQEMHEKASVRFYMYTTPKFLDYAQQSLDVKPEPTKKAKTEFEEIEKQDEQAADYSVTQWITAQPIYGSQFATTIPSTGFGYVNTFQGTVDSGVFDFAQTKSPSPEEIRHKNNLLQVLPFNGLIFSARTGKWTCEIESTPPIGTPDRGSYSLEFQAKDWPRKTRRLDLRVSLSRLKSDADWTYKQAITRAILAWLDGGIGLGEIDMAP